MVDEISKSKGITANLSYKATDLSDNELVEIIRSTDQERYGEIVERYQGKLFVIMDKDLSQVEKEAEYEEGKFLRAVGVKDKDDDKSFHAQRIRCCDDD